MVGKFLWMAVLVIQGQIVHADDRWNSFRGNPRLTGVAEGGLTSRPELLWTFAAGSDIESTAALWEGTAFVGSMDGYLHARWRFLLGNAEQGGVERCLTQTAGNAQHPDPGRPLHEPIHHGKSPRLNLCG